MGRTRKPAAALACALAFAVTLLAGHALAKKKGGSEKVDCAEYVPAFESGDVRVWKINVTLKGKEIYSGQVSWETTRREMVQGPVEYYPAGKGKKRVQAWRIEAGNFHQVFGEKKGLFQLYEWRQESVSETFRKPTALKRRMKLGKAYRFKNRSRYQDVEEDYHFDRKHEATTTLYRGGAFEGDEVAFDDTVRSETRYVRKSADATRIWIGDLEERFARGVGLVWQRDVWEFRDEYFGFYGTIRLAYDWREELLYATIGGVEYGDLSLR